jgi:hypothetical protein
MSTRRNSIWTQGLRAGLALLLLSAFGCAGQAWRSAVAEDTPAAYYRFMREYDDSKYSAQAVERLEFHKLKRNPTLKGFEGFRERYPDSDLIAELHPILEKPAFEAARAQGTVDAYRSFVDAFSNGSLVERAEGNAVYVAADGFGGDATLLGRFASDHPESDFAAEAERTAQATALRQGKPIGRVGLVLQIDASTPEIKRVHAALLDRIEGLAERVGLEIVQVPATTSPAHGGQYPVARLEVTHRESAVESGMKAGGLARPSIVGVTQVVLREKAGGAIIAKRRFELRVVDKEHVPGTSVLFSEAAPRYWDEFFIPAARWRNDKTIRPPIELGAPVVDVDAVGDRAIVLFENGSFEVLGLADPTQPVQLASYRRGEDYKRWSGVQLLGSRVAIYGEEGLELVRFGSTGPVAEATWDRGQIGRVLAIAMVDENLVIVGAKGMQVLDPATGKIRRVMRRVIQGLDAAGDVLVFADGETVYVSSLALLAENRVIAQMKLGRSFGPNNVRVHDRAAIVTGPGGALVIDLRRPEAPKALAKFSTREVGEIVDATRVRGRSFLIGARGVLLLNRELSRVEETIDISESNRVAVMGRHLVLANPTGVQVVDAAPWAETGSPAATGMSNSDALLNGSGF